MQTRLHISSFIGFTILVWLLALWVQGMPVLSIEFVKPFSIVVGISCLMVAIFNKYCWAWRIFQGWYVSRPDIRGTWKVELHSSWIDPSTSKGIEPIIGYIVVRQSLVSMSLRLMTKESRSKSIAYSFKKEDDGVFSLAAIYRNLPNIELQGVRSEIHHGSLFMEIYGNPVSELNGHYWTDRQTKGGIKLTNRNTKLFDTYEDASNSFE